MDSVLHRCPVCGVTHEVPQARARFAYGRQLACGCECEAVRRRRRRRSYRPAAAAPGSASSDNVITTPAEPVTA